MAFEVIKGVGYKVNCSQLSQAFNIPSFETIDFDREYKVLVEALFSQHDNILPYTERKLQMLGDKIRQIRIIRHLSESEVARRSGHPVSSIHGIENGDNKNPGFKIMYDLSRVLDFSLDELAGEIFK